LLFYLFVCEAKSPARSFDIPFYIFQLTGLGLLGVGIWARVQFSDYMKLSSHDYSTACYVLISAGVVVIIIGFIGCCGALKERTCMLKTVRDCLFMLEIIILYVSKFNVKSMSPKIKTLRA